MDACDQTTQRPTVPQRNVLEGAAVSYTNGTMASGAIVMHQSQQATAVLMHSFFFLVSHYILLIRLLYFSFRTFICYLDNHTSPPSLICVHSTQLVEKVRIVPLLVGLSGEKLECSGQCFRRIPIMKIVQLICQVIVSFIGCS